MPRKKKTREQKRKADERRSTSGESVVSQPSSPLYSYSLHTSQSVMQPKETVAVHTTIYHDLVKTAIVSVAIVALQLLFYFLLHNHVLAINFVRY